MEEGGWAAKLFSSALFCLWLSLASVTVLFDAGSGPAPRNERAPSPENAANRVSARAQATPERDAAAPEDAAANGGNAGRPLSRPTPGDGVEPDAA
jgi:hypothetical protein